MSEQPELYHIGHKIKRLREIKGIKQETLATEVGVSRGSIYKIEQSENVDEETLEKIATALNVTVEAIKNFNEETVINIIATTVNNHDQSASVFYNPTFNPIDKLLETIKENKDLYERLLKSEREKNDLLTKSLEAATKK